MSQLWRNWSPVLSFFTLKDIYPGNSWFYGLKQEFSAAKLIPHVGGCSGANFLPYNGWQRQFSAQPTKKGAQWWEFPQDTGPPPCATVHPGAVQVSFGEALDLENKGLGLRFSVLFQTLRICLLSFKFYSGHHDIIWASCLVSEHILCQKANTAWYHLHLINKIQINLFKKKTEIDPQRKKTNLW